ncbi:MAG: hypothetical protein JW743_10135 [Deltaproteobacteria bacterium]|nr:hypothetical protein [Deltaproteobacteria bacterium]MBN2844829.1 hypothetical protein [Deltaproteobacteria bacterium]
MVLNSNRISELHAVYRAIDDNFPEHLERCQTFLRQKSLSMTGERIRETAEMVRSYTEAIGGSVELWKDSSFFDVADEYMTVEGLRDFEKFVATFLYSMADREPPGGTFHQKTDAYVVK